LAFTRGSRFQRNGPTRRRKLAWFPGPISSSTPNTASANFVQAWTTGFSFSQGLTLRRTRGNIASWLTAATSIGDGYRMAFGLIQVQSEAFAIGVTALPDPRVDLEADWLYHRLWNIIRTSEVLAAAGERTFLDIEIDSKAMRKMDDGKTLVAVVAGEEVGTAVVEFQGTTRVLMSLF